MGLITRLSSFAQLAGSAWRMTGSPQWQRRDAADSSSADADALLWGDQLWSVPSITGININQQTALNAAAVMACVTMIAEDVAKLPLKLYRRLDNGDAETVRKDEHWLVGLLRRPNSWQNWMEFCEMLNLGLIMRGNGVAVIIRNARDIPIMLVPINPDRAALWEAADGSLFYRITPFGLHEMAVLKDQPFLIPERDVLHVRGFSLNGMMGASRISLAREALGLVLGQERQAAQLMGFGARPSGMLSTEQKLSDVTIERAKKAWKDLHAGLQNFGRTALLEAGLKWEPLTMTAQDLEFINSRQFQLQEIARIFRVPPHKIGELSRSTNNNITQQSQEYVNDTISGYTTRWKRKLDDKFDLDDEDMFVDFDLSSILEGDLVARYQAHRVGIMSGFLSRNEARVKEKLKQRKEADALLEPTNMEDAGSQSTGTSSDDSGRPADGTLK